MTTTRSYDALNRVVDTRTFNAQHATLNAHRYQYNTANQRTRRTEADGSYWDYGYDALGQVTSSARRWSDGVLVAGQQYDYEYDDIGNRATNNTNGRESIYTANALNQYTQRTVPGTVWELGSAASNATVTINNQPVARQGEYFAGEITVNNATSAVYTQLTTVAVLKNAASNQMDVVSSVTGKVFVARSPPRNRGHVPTINN
jgi:YD repeat-containing protein